MAYAYSYLRVNNLGQRYVNEDAGYTGGGNARKIVRNGVDDARIRSSDDSAGRQNLSLIHIFTLRCSPLYVRARSETFVDFAMGLPVATSTVELSLIHI